ncbi:MAG: carbamoyl-phosphate synthase large subunit, partial [Candidatus Binatota bacterium]
MNPRVSRSSALASKATGFPIAKIAAKLAVGYTLDEIPNDITRETPACFEPTIDYVVVKIPRFTFEKFPQAQDILTPQMKSVGEVMAIGRTFKESLQKAMRSLEIGSYGFEEKIKISANRDENLKVLRQKLETPNAQRLWYLADAFRLGMGTDEIHGLTRIDPWFLEQVKEIIASEGRIKERRGKTAELTAGFFNPLKQMGFSDRRLADLLELPDAEIRALRTQAGVRAVFRAVDTCGAEFTAYTPYLYSTYEGEDESNPTARKKIMILGGGPNRIGQGIEFDYCCVHAAFALKEDGYETIMVNCNPETVSTDYDTSDKLYFEPLTLEDVLNIVEREKPDGVIVQFGGQTPLKLALPLERAGVKIIGTSPDNIDLAEDRERFKQLLEQLGINQPESGTARSYEEAQHIAERIGYPVLVRPSYVLGGRAMEIVYDQESLRHYMTHAVAASPEHPVLIDKFLDDAVELDVDALADGERVVIGGIMEHIERAGVHSGDSACVLPPKSIGKDIQDEIRRQTVSLAKALNVRGLMNAQFAVKGRDIYVLEVNPRASRTVPFVSKAIGVPLAKLAARIMVGKKLADLGLTSEILPRHVSVKESVFPFSKFPGVDTLLGPEMKSTGEVMGMGSSFGLAFAKAQLGSGMRLPFQGKVFVSVRDEDKESVCAIAQRLHRLGFEIVATRGTAAYFQSHGLPAEMVKKVQEGSPHIAEAIKNGEIAMVINTPTDAHSHADSYYLRRNALDYQVPYFTTIAGADAAVEGIELLKEGELDVQALQEYQAASGRLG